VPAGAVASRVPVRSTGGGPLHFYHRLLTWSWYFHVPAAPLANRCPGRDHPMPTIEPPNIRRTLVVAARCAALSACCAVVSGCAAGAARIPDATATDAEWRSLAAPRPEPLPGAVRMSLAPFEIVGEAAWPTGAAVPPSLGLPELVAAGLLRRRDVHYVERRRFAAAARAERRGATRAPGAPEAGVSPGSEMTVGVVWLALAGVDGSLEVRLVDTATGQVRHASRASLPAGADAVAVSRLIVGRVLVGLRTLERLPDWTDPLTEAAPARYVPSVVPAPALASFLRGLEAEERWAWEPARRGYLAAASDPRFFESAAALARAARLRIGGTLGES